MAITAAMVKELRERTGAGMMECKKALKEVDADMEAAIELLRKQGAAKADKKAGRVAAEGVIGLLTSDDAKSAAIVEVNCETDFVAKGDDFNEFVQYVCQAILASSPSDLDALMALPAGDTGNTLDKHRQDMVGRIGENIQVRRFERHAAEEGRVGVYSHGGRIGVVVKTTADENVAKDVAMHIAATNPLCVGEADVPASALEKEKEILIAQAQDSGKPMEIIEKMVEGRLRKYLAEITLNGQPFVKDPDTTVGKLLKANNAEVAAFTRLEVGEGIEKKEENFADEVMAQVKAS